MRGFPVPSFDGGENSQLNPIEKPADTPMPRSPEFGYDPDIAEASVAVGDQFYKLEQVTLTEPTPELSILSGQDSKTEAPVTIEVLEDNGALEVICVTVGGEIIYQPPMQ